MRSFVASLRNIVLPFGATSGSRIVLDGTSNTILVYDSGGNLVVSIAAGSGTDSGGNHYPLGVNVQNASTFVTLSNGQILLGPRSGSTQDTVNAAVIQPPVPGSGDLVFSSGRTAALGTAAEMRLRPGTAGGASGPQLLLDDPTGVNDLRAQLLGTLTVRQVETAEVGVALFAAAGQTSNVAEVRSAANNLIAALSTAGLLDVAGALVKLDGAGAPHVWHTVGSDGGATTYGANWAAGTGSFNGSSGFGGALRYRLDGEDNLWLEGVFVAGAVAPGVTVFTLPAGYRPLAVGRVLVQEANAGTLITGYCTVDAAGNFNIRTAAGFVLAANATYQVNGKIPLGNI